MTRFKEAAEIYETLSDGEKVVFADLDGSGQVEALEEAAVANDEFNAYCDRLAERRTAFLASEARREDVACDQVLASVHTIIGGAHEATRTQTANILAGKASKAAIAAVATPAVEAGPEIPASNDPATPAENDPTPPGKDGK
ncbi:MAG: hypothetical protein ACYTFG_03965, partial [Planctomycetota bacterium]|jgi:hypothetical protein